MRVAPNVKKDTGRIGAGLFAVARRTKAEGIIRRFNGQSRSVECAVLSHMPNDRRHFGRGASSSRSIYWSGSKPSSWTISRACARRSRRRGPTSSLHDRRIRRVIRSSAGVWTLPPGDCDVSTRWRLINSRCAGALPKRDRAVFLTLRTAVIPGRATWREPGIQR